MAELTKEQKDALSALSNSLCGRMSESFSRIARRRVEIKFSGMEIEDYQKYLESLPHFTTIGIYSTELSKDQILIEVNARVSYYLLDKMLGGKGDAGPLENKKFTEIERTLFHKFIFSSLVPPWEEVWETMTGLKLKFDIIRVESDPYLTRRMDGKFIHTIAECSFERGKENLNICIPHKLAELIGTVSKE